MIPLCDHRHVAVTTLCLSLPTASSTKPFTAQKVKLHSQTLSSADMAQKGWREMSIPQNSLQLHHSTTCAVTGITEGPSLLDTHDKAKQLVPDHREMLALQEGDSSPALMLLRERSPHIKALRPSQAPQQPHLCD